MTAKPEFLGRMIKKNIIGFVEDIKRRKRLFVSVEDLVEKARVEEGAKYYLAYIMAWQSLRKIEIDMEVEILRWARSEDDSATKKIEENSSEFGKELERLRSSRNFSKITLALRLGINVQAVAKWETGSVLPSESSFKRFVKVLRLNLDELRNLESLAPKYSQSDGLLRLRENQA